jgi:hypothetical protein
VREPSEKMLERARHDPLIRRAITVFMNSSQSYEEALEALALALSDERKRLLDTAIGYAERCRPEALLLGPLIHRFPDDYTYVPADGGKAAATTRSPWDDTGRDIMKDIADAKKQAERDYAGTMRKAAEPAKSVVLGDCKVCGAPFSVPVRKGIGTFPDIIGRLIEGDPDIEKEGD